jgi:hypothetical protein
MCGGEVSTSGSCGEKLMAIGDPFPFEKRAKVKSSKPAKRVKKQKSSPVLSALGIKVKGRPRGKSFEKGHGFGSAYRFKKGQSGNPGGRPKCAEISSALRAKLKSETTKKLRGRTYAEKLVDEWVEQGLDGNVSAISGIADRAEGRPAVTIIGDGRPDAVHLLIEGMTNRSREIGHPEGWMPPLLEAGEEQDEAQSDE